nr:hypothetical protein [Candidatus Aminicenantes bacterium]
MIHMQIPIRNIYYLLCYAYNKLEESQLIDIRAKDTTELVDLFTRILSSGTAQLIKRGLERGYVLKSQESKSIRGKINFNTSIKKDLFRKVMVHCEYDELSHDILHNRILKSTMRLLIDIRDVNERLRGELSSLMRQMSDVNEIALEKNIFSRVQLNSNNSFYDFVLKICELIFSNIMVSEKLGQNKFRDFLRDEKQM